MIVGLLVGSAINFAVITLNTMIFPLPEGVTMADRDAFKAAVQDMPALAWLGVIVAHLGQAFVGGWVAARLGASRPVLLAMIVGVLSLAVGVANAIMLETPAWTWIEMPGYLLVAWFAGRLEAKRRAA
ncbi:MAG: hypothetical protein AAGH19_11705 [Pseudomonadota bacterium]